MVVSLIVWLGQIQRSGATLGASGKKGRKIVLAYVQESMSCNANMEM
jgi:hypothetical protein